MDFKRRIKEIREKLGISQKELANKLGITPQALSAYERADSYPRAKTLKKMADALNMSVEELKPNIMNSIYSSAAERLTEESVLVDRYKRLTPEDKLFILRLLSRLEDN